jgi:PAS domain S-box-containing protein
MADPRDDARGRPLVDAMFATRFLLELSDDTERALQDFTDVLVPAFADSVAVFVLGEAGDHVDLVAFAHPDEEVMAHVDAIRRLPTRGPTLPGGTVALSGEPYLALDLQPTVFPQELGPELASYLAVVRPRSLLVFPLVAAGASFGSLLLSRREGTPPFTDDDIWFAESLAGRVAVVLRSRQLRAALEESLEVSERDRAVLDAIVAKAPFGLAFLDPDLTYVLANTAMESMHGLSSDELIGRHRDAVVGQPLADETEPLIRRVMDTGDALTYETSVVVGGNPEPRDLEVTYFAVDGHDGRRLGVAAMFLDRTERNAAERRNDELQLRLAQTQRLETVGQLAGAVAHDFNNLLAVISLRSELLRRKRAGDAELAESLAIVERAVDQGRELAARLLAFSRRQPVEAVVVEPATVIAGFAGLLRATLGPGVALDLDLGPGRVLFDPGALEQVLLNLAVNAREAMPDGGRLTVATRAHGDHLRLSVSDDGEGMTDEVREHAFDPFFTTRGTGIGTGLGLSSVYGLVTGAGGTVHLDSAPGAGTTVVIALPLVEAPASGGVLQRPTRPLTSSTILVVDDEEDLLDVVVEALTGAGYRVVSATSADDAVEQSLTLAELDMVVSDVLLPGTSGAALVRRLQSDRPGLAALFISGYAPAAAGEEALPEGVPLLRKPFSVDELLEAVGAGLGRRG